MPSKPRVKTARTFEEFKKVLNSKFPHLSNLRRNSIANLGVQIRNGKREPKNVWANLKEISVDEFLSLFEVPINSLPSAAPPSPPPPPPPPPSPPPPPLPPSPSEEDPVGYSNVENHTSEYSMPTNFTPIKNNIISQAPVPLSPHEEFLRKFGKKAKITKRTPWHRKSRRIGRKSKRTTRR
jgi:hypothetical protein